MIINPQLLKYRLTNGILVVALVFLGIFTFSIYSELIENQNFIEQEKNLVENELSEIISSYDVVEVENSTIKNKLEDARSKMNRMLDSVRQLKSSAPLISNVKIQLVELKAENAQVLATIHDLKEENNVLKQQTNRSNITINKNSVAASKNINEKPDKVAAGKKEKQNGLKSKTNKLATHNFYAKAVSHVTFERIVDTEYARKTNMFHVCVTLEANTLLQKGKKDIYIQVLDSKTNVIADKGTATFKEKSIIFSEKKTINYNNEDVKVCALIEKRIDEIIAPGTYYITIVYDGQTLEKTTIELK